MMQIDRLSDIKNAKKSQLMTMRIRNASNIKMKAFLNNRGIETCDDVANVIKDNHKRIRAFQVESIKQFKRKLKRERKLNCISFSFKGSTLEKKNACLPIREIERDILSFNGELLSEVGFEWKLCRMSITRRRYQKLLCLKQWKQCECGECKNFINHKQCIITSFIQAFILGAICMKFNGIQKDLKMPKRNEIMKKDSINEESLINLLLRIQYQSLRVNITNVRFDLFNRNDKMGYLTIKSSLSRYFTSKQLYNTVLQQHDALVILRNSKNHKQLFFGIAIFQAKYNEIKIKVHHKNIAMYDVYDKKEEWTLYVAPYCVKHAILCLFQKIIDEENQ